MEKKQKIEIGTIERRWERFTERENGSCNNKKWMTHSLW